MRVIPIKRDLIKGLISALMLSIFILMSAPVFAQGQGQICIRNYDDRNSNATYEPGEPLLTRGVTASLLNSENVIVRSLLLEDSPQATQGLMCFQNLNAGQYTVQVASADYSATTGDTFVTAVTDTSIPQVFEFGAQVIVLDNTAGSDSVDALADVDVQGVLQRVFLAGIGALMGIGAMVVLGTLIYYFFLRSRSQPVYATDPYASPQYRTGEHPASRMIPDEPPASAIGTGEHPASRVSTGEHPASSAMGSYASAGGYVSSAKSTTPPPMAAASPSPTTSTPDVSDDIVDDTPFELPDWDDVKQAIPTTPAQALPAVPDRDDAPPPIRDDAQPPSVADDALPIQDDDVLDDWVDNSNDKPARKDESKGFDPFSDTGNYDMFKPPKS